MRQWRDETALRSYLFQRMLGVWRPLEALGHDGFPDSVGLLRTQTMWLELKLGRPRVEALRPGQVQFAQDCIQTGVPWFICFGHDGRPRFFESLDLRDEKEIVPFFWAGATVPLRHGLGADVGHPRSAQELAAARAARGLPPLLASPQ